MTTEEWSDLRGALCNFDAIVVENGGDVSLASAYLAGVQAALVLVQGGKGHADLVMADCLDLIIECMGQQNSFSPFLLVTVGAIARKALEKA